MELDRDQVQQLSESHRWQRASSPQYQSKMMAHEYSLRRFWPGDDAAFDACVSFIREHGERRMFGRWLYAELVLGEFFYWNIPPSETERWAKYGWRNLINRKPTELRELRPRIRQRQIEPPLQVSLWD